jgi:AmmeMemoRadiSam system radical SAM enzyme/AmmeMemoRadiSam system protein B/AmmeMemoRadiSam system protein A
MFKLEIAAVVILIAAVIIGVSMKKNEKSEEGNMQPVKNMTEASYYEKFGGDRVKCKLCPHGCMLNDGQSGVCNARKNIGGILYTLNYGKPVAINVDPVEKKPLFHFLSGTGTFSIGCAGCNLSCIFCQNWKISQASPEDVPFQAMSPQEVIQHTIDSGSDSVSFTYNEPLIFYEMVLETAKLAKEKGLKNILVTNGYINPEPLKELVPYIDAANIDLKGFSEEFYKKYTGTTLKPVLEAIKIFKKAGVHIEITNLLIPGANDKPEEIRALVKWVKENTGTDTPMHFSRFFPAYKMSDASPTPVKTIEMARNIALEEGMKYVYTGNLRSENGEDTVCPKCGKKLIDRDGYRIIYNKIKDGKCSYCGEEIKGMWKKEKIKAKVRKPAVANMWYPADKKELLKLMEELDRTKCQKYEEAKKPVIGLIAPHAGFVYSGPTAACGFKALKGEKYERVVLLGTSHKFRNETISVYEGTEAWTPLGNLKIDTDFTGKLLASDEKIIFTEAIHSQEHSLESMFPFIKYYLGDPEIVLILASTQDEKLLQKAGNVIADLIKESGKKTLLLASTDMSHFHPYDDAAEMDKETIKVIESGNYNELRNRIMSKKGELCGYDSLISFLTALGSLGNEKGKFVMYQNSGDVMPESKSRGVVGYLSMIFESKEEKKTENKEETMNYYNDTERKELLELARKSIGFALKNNRKQYKPEKPSNKKLVEERAVFVTLKIDGELRGCIGQMIATQPLYLAVADAAYSAAFRDTRFNQLTEEEFKQIHIEISVLTPMEKVDSWEELKVGVDGVYIKKGYRAGVFLPQVATETGWDLETFLSNLCSHKAGLPSDCYKDPNTEIYKYQVELFEE